MRGAAEMTEIAAGLPFWQIGMEFALANIVPNPQKKQKVLSKYLDRKILGFCLNVQDGPV